MIISIMIRELQCLSIMMLGIAVVGIQVTSLHVPPFARVGDSIRLQCVWTTDEVAVYTVKWYFGSHEFYRWTPAESPSIQVFALSAFAVDREASDRSVVVLRNLTLMASGIFKCEVSGEKPAFPTDHRSARLEVMDPPREGPFMRGLENPYHINELVSLNCSSPPSKPPAELAFYVNGEPVDDAWILNYPPDTPSSSLLGIRFPLRSRLLKQGHISIKCSASIPQVYFNSVQVVVKSDLPFYASTEGRTSAGTRIQLASLGAVAVLLLVGWIL